MAARVQEVSLEEFSKAFLAFQRMPRTWRVRMKDVKAHRMKRSDTLIKMHPLKAPRVPRVESDANVSELIAAAALSLSTDVVARRWQLQIYTPADDGVGLVNAPKNRVIKLLLREEDERQAEMQLDDETESLLVTAEEHVLEAHDLADEPELTVPRAYLRALVDRYGPKLVRQAFKANGAR